MNKQKFNIRMRYLAGCMEFILMDFKWWMVMTQNDFYLRQKSQCKKLLPNILFGVTP